MPKKIYATGEIVAKPHQVDVLVLLGRSAADGIREIGVREVSCAMSYSSASLLEPLGGSDRH